MALVHQPINLKEILSEIAGEAEKIRRKTKTLIEYYIYPDSTPSAIAAYEPRIAILEARTKALAKIKFPHLAQILDLAEALGSSYLNDIIDQLLNAVHGLDEVFKEHYDRTLEERKPYLAIYRLLEHREKQLKNFYKDSTMNPSLTRPENMVPSDPIYFCRGAIQMINRRDQGRIQPVKERDLSETNRGVMKRFGGGYLWWECSSCKFRTRFHMVNSNNMSIHTVEEIREHPNMAIEYRSAFLAKSHLFAPTSDEERIPRRRSSSVFSSSNSVSLKEVAKYGCIFCFAEGKTLEQHDRTPSQYGTAFEGPRDLAEHLIKKHKSPLPPSLMLQKFNVAVKGKCAEHVWRWDINFK